MTMSQGRLYQPEHAGQEVLANGAACGFQLGHLAEIWSSPQNYALVYYPIDQFDPDEEPVKTPITEATMHYGAEDLPILAWVVGHGGGSVAVVVDMLERSKLRTNHGGDEPAPYSDCKVIQGAPWEILPKSIRDKMGLR